MCLCVKGTAQDPKLVCNKIKGHVCSRRDDSLSSSTLVDWEAFLAETELKEEARAKDGGGRGWLA